MFESYQHNDFEEKNMIQKANVSYFKTRKGWRKYEASYNKTLQNWPVDYTSHYIKTRYGTTHIVVSGSESSPPLLLLPAAGLSATLWIHNVSELSHQFRTYAVDILGEPGKSVQFKPLKERTDCAEWLIDILNHLEIKKCFITGISFGGWFGLNFALYAPNRVEKLVLLAPAASLWKFSLPILISLKFGRFQWIFPTKLTQASLYSISTQKNNFNRNFVKQFGIGIKEFRFPKDGVFPSKYSDNELKQLKPSTLILIGEKEVIYDPKKALKRAKTLIPDVEVDLIPDASHLLNVDQSNIVNQKIIEFLNEK